MATAEEAARFLMDKSHAIAQKIDSTPTGVAPGYHAAVGGAVLPNGRLRYASGTPPFLAVADIASTQTVTTASQRIPFNTVKYDALSAITTGASWKYDLPATGWYRAYVRMEIDKGPDVADRGEAWQANVYDSTLASLVGPIQQQMFFVAVSSATISGFKLIGHLDFQITSLPYAIAITLDRNTTAHNRDVTGGRWSLEYLGA